MGLLCRLGRSLLRVYRGGEAVEEVVGHLAGGAVDQARADLGQLAADLRRNIVAQHGLAAVLLERDLGAALGEAGDPAGALAADRVAVGRVEVAERDLAREARLDRPDPRRDLGGELGVRDLLDRVAAGDCLLQPLGVVELLPHQLARSRDAALALHFHRRMSSKARQPGVWAAAPAIATPLFAMPRGQVA